MNTRRNAARRLEEAIADVGDPPRDDQLPLLEKGENDDQASVNPPYLMDENIRAALFKMAQAIPTQA